MIHSSNIKHKKHLRADAAWTLFNILEKGYSSRDCLPLAFERHNPKDNAWLQEMVFGVLRHLPQLQYWLREMLSKPLKGDKKIIEQVIMLGFYQLAFSRVSEHAAVSETVEACAVFKAHSLKGLVNATLRRFQRENISSIDIKNRQIQSGLPKWLFKHIVTFYAENADTIIEQTNARPPLWLRVNHAKTTTAEYSQQLTEAGVEHRLHNHLPAAIYLEKSIDIRQMPFFEEGFFSVQDAAAQLAAQHLDVKKGDRVLDCCAAPGGKTAHIIEAFPTVGHVTAIDNDAARLTRIEENFARLGHKATLIVGDAVDPHKWWDKQLFDRILLDAPCSATGVIRRHPDIRWLRKKTDINALVSLQRTILDAVWSMLKPGGTLLYATCSILPMENSEQISLFLSEHDDAMLIPLDSVNDNNAIGQQILPGDNDMDGFYYAKLQKAV